LPGAKRFSITMRYRPFLLWAVCLTPCATIVAVQGQNAAKTATPKNPAPDKTKVGAVTVRGETSIYDDVTKTSQLTGKVVVTQTGEDFILYAQSLVYNKTKNWAVASGSLRVETRDSTITAARIDADFDTKTLVMTGKVVVSSHGKGDGITGNRKGDSLRSRWGEKSSKIYCDRVDWDYETHEATLTGKNGRIRIEQDKSSGTCERILYDERQNVAQLLGKVRFKDADGQIFNTPNLTIYIDENRIATGNATVTIPRDQKPDATPRPTKAPVREKKAPQITDDDMRLFNLTPPPIPTPQPEAPEPVDVPTVAPEPNAPGE
jgi:lipopolysaccharide export system protein LptA